MFPEPGRPTREDTDLAFEAMLATAEPQLRGGGRVALDGCCFAARWQRQRARRLAESTGAELIEVHLELPAAEAVRRVELTGHHPATDRDAALVARVAEGFAPPEPEDLVIDASRLAGEVWAALSRRLTGPCLPGIRPG